MNNISLQSIKTYVSWVLNRFHIIIFILVALGGLIAIIFILNNILIASSTYTSENNTQPSSLFDQKTIDKINELRTNNGIVAPFSLSNNRGRINPFVE